MARSGILLLLILGSTPVWAAPMTLEQAFRLALGRSDIVKVAGNELASALVVEHEAWTLYGPSALLTVEGVEQRQIALPTAPTAISQTVQTPQQLIFTGSLTQPLFRPAFVWAHRAGAAGYESASGRAKRVVEQLRLDVVTVFLQTLKARRVLEVARATRERAEAQLRVATVRKSLGEVLKSSVLEAEIDVLRADRQLSEAKGAVDDAAAIFEFLVGVQPPELVPPETPVTPAVVEAMAAAAQRSDVQAQRAAAMQVRGRIGVAAALLWPSLELQGQVSQAWPQADFTFNKSGFNWRALVQLTVPLFQGGDEWLKLKLAKLDAQSAEQRVALLEKTVRQDVARAAAALEARARALAIAERTAVAARENYALVQAQFKNGRATSTDVVVAQSTLAEAESQQAVASFDRDQAAFQLLFAAGML